MGFTNEVSVLFLPLHLPSHLLLLPLLLRLLHSRLCLCDLCEASFVQVHLLLVDGDVDGELLLVLLLLLLDHLGVLLDVVEVDGVEPLFSPPLELLLSEPLLTFFARLVLLLQSHVERLDALLLFEELLHPQILKQHLPPFCLFLPRLRLLVAHLDDLLALLLACLLVLFLRLLELVFDLLQLFLLPLSPLLVSFFLLFLQLLDSFHPFLDFLQLLVLLFCEFLRRLGWLFFSRSSSLRLSLPRRLGRCFGGCLGGLVLGCGFFEVDSSHLVVLFDSLLALLHFLFFDLILVDQLPAFLEILLLPLVDSRPDFIIRKLEDWIAAWRDREGGAGLFQILFRLLFSLLSFLRFPVCPRLCQKCLLSFLGFSLLLFPFHFFSFVFCCLSSWLCFTILTFRKFLGLLLLFFLRSLF
ncbi:hypothetical protein BLNAU_6411 [Blattamonas nauphoetae]|uniref:Uncharacterized protein n=1 Tax=Blattamonas nauphoetae TaxID=2049346 RepID=A0ABQ9Y4G9_9EUKA|nr:hypothetical protein BLNAU_6411 [Blattamonas nauphoetae]